MNSPVIPARMPGAKPGIILFLNAGDPAGEDLEHLLLACDEYGITAVELAVPFPDSPTDGPTVRRSADRALARGADLASTLEAVSRIRPRLKTTRIALLVDWGWSLDGQDPDDALARVASSGADALLVHGLPARERQRVLDAARALSLPMVTTCYHGHSMPGVLQRAAREATGYVYLVSRFGRSGTASELDVPGLTRSVEALRQHGSAPVAIGFGVRGPREIEQVGQAGADAAIIGSAAVTAVEEGLEHGDLIPRFRSFLAGLTATPDLLVSTP